MKLGEYLSVIEKFLRDALARTKLDGFVLGLSGGIDSALVAAIASRATPGRLFGLIMPCASHTSDAEDAKTLAIKFHIPFAIVDLTSSYRHMLQTLEEAAMKSGQPLDDLARSNMKVRLRMVTLYAFAQARRALVLGTDNMDESYTGYFTKYGDGAVDLLPIVELTKGEVYAASRMYGIPEAIIARPPTAGLFPGQTDEGEMRVTYADLDKYLLGGNVDEAVKARIEHLHMVSAHKREPIPRPAPFTRD